MDKLCGIDVSHWQGDKGFNPAIMNADFIICKATERAGYKDKTLEKMADATLASGKLLGLYHFAKGVDSAKDEANWFVDNIQKYLGKALLVLDWEADVMKKGPAYAKEFCNTVYARTKIKPIIYMSTSTTTAFNWSDFIKDYPYLWGAEYNANLLTRGYTVNPKKKNRSLGGFTEIIRQYSSNTYLDGFSDRLDVNEAYITKEQWKKLASVDPIFAGKTAEPAKESTPSISVHEAAQNIVDGKPGWKVNGAARTAKAKSLGIDPAALQAEINKIVAERDAKTTSTPAATTESKPTMGYYTIQKGDTGIKIAKKFGLTTTQLKKLNPNISNLNQIRAGQAIRVK